MFVSLVMRGVLCLLRSIWLCFSLTRPYPAIVPILAPTNVRQSASQQAAWHQRLQQKQRFSISLHTAIRAQY